MELGKTQLLRHKALLAPMAGVADRAFRELCVSFGAGYVVSEMVSAKGLVMGDRKSRELLELSDRERPGGIQLFGNDPAVMAQAAKLCEEYEPQSIDINMGCPAPKITGGGSGSALMKQPALAGEIIAAVTRAVSIPVTVKLRAGWDEDSKNAVELARIAQQAGAAAVTVHGRTRQQMYAPPVDIALIAAVKAAIDIPVIANGDITDGISAKRMLDETGCDAVMIGRGALGQPWLFAEVCEYLQTGQLSEKPAACFRMEVMLRHIESLCAYKGEKRGLLEARKHVAWYIRDVRNAAAMRKRVFSLSSLDELRQIARETAQLIG